MAEYLIQGETLDDIADAINAKTGGSSAMTPAEMVTAIGSIQTGGGGSDDLSKFLNDTLTSIDDNSVIAIREGLFANTLTLQSIRLPNATSTARSAFSYTSGLVSVYLPKLATISAGNLFEGSAIPIIALPSLSGTTNSYAFRNNPSLTTVDLGVDALAIGSSAFASDSNFTTLILRKTNAIVTLYGTNAFTGTPFASGGSGGTIYIPKALYDHLGDGTALDYKAATNWSTIDGYGTITWAKIEGSIYETQYADGTTIPTE